MPVQVPYPSQARTTLGSKAQAWLIPTDDDSGVQPIREDIRIYRYYNRVQQFRHAWWLRVEWGLYDYRIPVGVYRVIQDKQRVYQEVQTQIQMLSGAYPTKRFFGVAGHLVSLDDEVLLEEYGKSYWNSSIPPPRDLLLGRTYTIRGNREMNTFQIVYDASRAAVDRPPASWYYDVQLVIESVVDPWALSGISTPIPSSSAYPRFNFQSLAAGWVPGDLPDLAETSTFSAPKRMRLGQVEYMTIRLNNLPGFEASGIALLQVKSGTAPAFTEAPYRIGNSRLYSPVPIFNLIGGTPRDNIKHGQYAEMAYFAASEEVTFTRK